MWQDNNFENIHVNDLYPIIKSVAFILEAAVQTKIRKKI